LLTSAIEGWAAVGSATRTEALKEGKRRYGVGLKARMEIWKNSLGSDVKCEKPPTKERRPDFLGAGDSKKGCSPSHFETANVDQGNGNKRVTIPETGGIRDQ